MIERTKAAPQHRRADAILAREIRDRPGHSKGPMHPARRHAAAVHGVGEQAPGCGIERAVLARRGVRDRALRQPCPRWIARAASTRSRWCSTRRAAPPSARSR